MFRRVKFRDEIKRLGLVRQRHESVRKAFRDVKHRAVFRGQFDGEMFQERRRIRAQVNDGVENRAAQAAENLVLGPGRKLVVQPAQRAAVFAERIVDLDDFVVEAVLLVFAFAEKAREKAALVAAFFEFDDAGAFERGPGEFHGCGASQGGLPDSTIFVSCSRSRWVSMLIQKPWWR